MSPQGGSRVRLARCWQVLLVVAAGNFLGWLDATVVNIALPSIGRAFAHSSLGGISWVLNAYSVVFAACLIPFGRIADLAGRRRVFLGGLVVFMAGSALCAAAPGLGFLIAARVLQSVGAAAMVPTSLALLLPEFPAERRATAVGLWAASAGVASAAGPVLGGLVVDWEGWRAVFLLNLPIGAVALIAGRAILREARAPKPPASPDLLGAALLGDGIALVALGIVKSPEWGWLGTRTIAAAAGALVLLGAFAARSARHRAPVVAPELLRIRSFALANLGSLLFSTAFFAWLLCDVLYLTGVWGYSTLTAGLALSPAPIMAATGSAVCGRIADRRGARVLAVPAALLFAAGAALFAATAGTHPRFLVAWLPGTLLAGAGVGVGMTALASAAAASLPPHALGAGGAVNITARQIGAVLGVAILVSIVGTRSGVHALRMGWLFCVLAALAAAAIAVALAPAARQPAPGSAPAAAPEPTAEAVGA
jgi:EmrB/QacA subfamily drug resistance transporter